MQVEEKKSQPEISGTPPPTLSEESEIKVFAAAQTQPVTPACQCRPADVSELESVER